MNGLKQKGFTLVELLVGMVLSLIILVGAAYVFQGSAESSIFQMRSTRFIQQMRDVMDRMVSDIRRAGYRGYHYYVNANTITFDNPYTAYSGTVTDVTTHGDTSCITYAYNLDDYNEPYSVQVGGLSTMTTADVTFDEDNMELFAFKRFVEDGVGVIKMRYGMDGDTDFDCNDSHGDWAAITDPELVDITTLTFDINRSTVTTSGSASFEVRQVEIYMRGVSRKDSALDFEVRQVVDLPNNRML